MKKLTSWFMMAVMVLMASSITSCSSDDEPVLPVFPTQSETVTGIAPGATSEMTISPNLDWKLSSNKTWLELSASNGAEGQDIQGKAADNVKVTLSVSDEKWGFTEDKAEVTMTMGNETKVIATVTRAAKPYELKLVDAEGNTLEALAIESNRELTFSVDANFEYSATVVPSWLDLTLENKVYTAVVKAELAQNPLSGTIKFENENGKASFEYAVTYSGMHPEDIDFNPSTKWNLNISADGLKIKSTNIDGEKAEVAAPYVTKVTALNDAYTLVYLKYREEWGYAQYQPEYGDIAWFKVEDDTKGNIKVTFDENTGAARTGVLVALPNAVVEKAASDLDSFLFDTTADVWELKPECERYVIAEFQQEAGQASESGIVVRNGMTYDIIDAAVVTDPATLEEIMGNCNGYEGVSYEITVPAGTPLVITPNLPASSWDPGMGIGNIMILDGTDGEWEPGMDDSGNWIVVYTTSEAERSLLMFHDAMWQPLKVLVVNKQ